MKKIKLTYLLLLLSTLSTFAVPAFRGIMVMTQPDGTSLSVLRYGDESFSYTTTDDGFVVQQNELGFYEYAAMDVWGAIRTRGVVAKNSSNRNNKEKRFLKNPSTFGTRISDIVAPNRRRSVVSQKSYPLSGNPKSLVILAEFTNKKFSVPNPQQAYTALLNQAGYSTNGGTGSARDYFSDNSNGVFAPDFIVVGPVSLDQTYNYYGQNINGSDANPRQMIIDACKKADTLGVDFSEYDTDGDGFVDNVFVYYAGYNAAEGGPDDAVWPHRWTLSTPYPIDGKKINDYACTSELKGNSGSNMCGIGTFVHEFGHVLGLPDFYATNGAKHATLGSWDVMDAGPYNNAGRTPPGYSAYERFFLGWLTPTVLNQPSLVTLESLLSTNKACLITQSRTHNLNGKSPSPTQFILLENRQKSDWDAYLPGHGLLVTRVNYNASTWRDNGPNNIATALGVDIIEAGMYAVNSASDPFPGTANVTSFRPTLRSGIDIDIDINQPLTYISESGGIVSFRYDGGGAGFPHYEAFPKTLNPFITVQEQPSDSQLFAVVGTKLIEPLKLSLKNGANFSIRPMVNPSSEWVNTTFSLSPMADSTLNVNVAIRYLPLLASFDEFHRDTLVITADKYTTYEIPLKGQSGRPILVEVPVARTATDTTSSSFVANWDAAFDATGYYLSVYAFTGTENTLSEGFASFKDDIIPTDWLSNFTTNDKTIFGKEEPSLTFSSSSDTLYSERYLFPIEKISFWMHSLGATGSKLFVDGFDGENWERIQVVDINATMKKVVKELSLPASNTYSRFRMMYEKNNGKMLFDDFTVHFTQNVTYVYHHKYTTNLSEELSGLSSNTTYKYRVQATDKTPYYENITGYSNEIEVLTTQFILNDPTQLTIRVKSSGGGYEVEVTEFDANHRLYIYSIQGQVLAEVTPTSNIISIPTLPENGMYILKYSKKDAIKRADPSTKLFYHIN